MGKLVDGLKKNRVLTFVLSLALVSSLALPTLGFANGEAADPATTQETVEQGTDALDVATEFDEGVGSDLLEVDVVDTADVAFGSVVDPNAEALPVEGVGAVVAGGDAGAPAVEALTAATPVEEFSGAEGEGYSLLMIEESSAEIERLSIDEIVITFDATKQGWLEIHLLDIGGNLITPESVAPYVVGSNYIVYEAPEIAQAEQIGIIAYYEGDDGSLVSQALPLWSQVPAWDSDLAKDITSFEVNGVSGVIEAGHIFLHVPKGVVFENASPTIAISGDEIDLVGDGEVLDVTTSVTFTPSTPVRYVVWDTAGNYRLYDVYVVYIPTITDLVVERTGLYQAKVSFTSDSVGEWTFMYGPNSAEKTVSFGAGDMVVGSNEASITWSATDEGFSLVDEWKNDHAAAIPVFTVHVRTESPTDAYFGIREMDKRMPAWTPPTPMIDKFVIKVPGKDPITANIDQATGKITAEVPYGTDRRELTTDITYTGEELNPVAGLTNLTSPVSYTVTGLEGTTPKTYEVTVTVAAPKPPSIDAFSLVLPNGDKIGANISDKVMTATVPYGTDLTTLQIELTITGILVSPSPIIADFSKPVTYTVTGEDGQTTAVYTLNVTVADPSAANDITSFVIDGNTGTITGTEIVVEVPFGTDVTALTPVVGVSEYATYSPAGAQDFSAPVTYTVTAQNEATKDYTVRVVVLPEVVVEEPAAETPSTSTTVPKTGDSAPALILIMALLAAAGLTLTVTSCKRTPTSRHTK